LNFNYDSNDSQNKFNSGNNIGNSQAGKGSTNFQTDEQPNDRNAYNDYEQNQFNDFLRKLMDVESKIEDAKISLAINPDFNCEDAFRLFETNDKGFLDKDDIKEGLNLLCIFPTDKELNLLMKRFDLQKNGFLNYGDFFDMVVPFEKNYRQRIENRPPRSCCPCRSPEIFSNKTIYYLKNLFNLLINSEYAINNDRRLLGTLRLKLHDIFGLLDQDGKGYFDNKEMMEYFDNNGLLDNNRDADLLFIRLDKNRNGKIDYPEVEDELQTLY
jgi:Ca2+-binding EF-hand superfamily protein